MNEITLRGIILSIILAIILAASNTYLALKIGILTSASIPAAVLAMGILRFFKDSSILEKNLVQTGASAGEAIAGGIVYTIPALVIIQYWSGFSYWHNFFIAVIGGVLGILFSIPMRRVLMNEPNLRFPEAQAITQTLQMAENKEIGIKEMLTGGLLGAALEFAQSGLQVIASSVQGFFAAGKTLIGFGLGFSATLVGAGYLIGFNVGLSLLIGAVTGWLIIVPILSGIYHLSQPGLSATDSAITLWGNYVRFVGIGAMLAAGTWTLLSLLKPMGKGIAVSFRSIDLPKESRLQTEQDLPFNYVILGILLCGIASFFLLKSLLPLGSMGLPGFLSDWIFSLSLAFIIIVGFIFAAICGYFSGLVGVSASPGSAIVIGGLLLVSIALRAAMHAYQIGFSHEMITNACAIVIVLISVVTGIACISNDNIQDLKVGHLLGSTPWKQQFMLLVGVLAASAVIPLLMQLLFNVYGIGGVMPHPGMDPSKMLPAPVPSVLAIVTQAVFNGELPLDMLLLGASIIIGFIVLNFMLRKKAIRLSILGIAMGLYLPLSSSTPLFIGSLIAFFLQRLAQKRQLNPSKTQRSVVMACGIVAGAALMDVMLAIPFAIKGDPNALKIMPEHLHFLAVALGILSLAYLARMLYKQALV
ncbi:MAG: oligopeptide transporter [Gammaproteobacteria bacterium]|jgi:putative OPT family oligopeptide transporter|nr:oligopeptide transporter [Gammaproteobacteria bacterium]